MNYQIQEASPVFCKSKIFYIIYKKVIHRSKGSELLYHSPSIWEVSTLYMLKSHLFKVKSVYNALKVYYCPKCGKIHLFTYTSTPSRMFLYLSTQA